MHPGVFLERHYLKPLGLTQSETARRLGVSRRRVHELVHGQRAMSADTALRCAQAFGLPAAEWLAMQSEWDARCAWRVLRRHMQDAQDVQNVQNVQNVRSAQEAAEPAPSSASPVEKALDAAGPAPAAALSPLAAPASLASAALSS